MKEKAPPSQWEEPALAAKPSYQDHNGVPYGVLEHMQPLGEAPNAKVKARIRSEVPRKSLLGRSSVAVGLDAQETPEGTPVPPATPQVTSPVKPEDSKHPAVVIDDDRDADYAPVIKKKERGVKGRSSKHKSEAGPAHSKSSSSHRKSSTSNINVAYDHQKLKRVVDAAKDRALQVGKPELAAAVHEIWQQSLSDHRLFDLLQVILTQSANPKQTEEFQHYVREAKKKLKVTEQQASRKQSAKSKAANGTQGLPTRSPSKFTSTETSTSAVPSTEITPSAKPKVSIEVKSPHKDPHRRRSGHTSAMSDSPQKKGHRSRTGSDSSLTPLTSDGEAMDVDEQERPNGGVAATSAHVNGIKTKDHAAERGTLAAPDRGVKRSSADMELQDQENERALTAKKRKLVEEQVADPQVQESDMRGSMRQPPAQARTRKAKNSSLVPQSLTLAPNGTRNVSTRGSRAVSTDLDSPISDLSPPSSRHSTPHIYRGPPKPPGKRAKTKTS